MKGEKLTTIVPLVLVGALVGFTFWLDQVAQPPARSTAGNRHDPDYIVEGLSAVRMNASGAPGYTLSAAKMTHFPDDDTTVLAGPRFVSYSAGKSPVTITSSQAVVSSNGDNVYFQND